MFLTSWWPGEIHTLQVPQILQPRQSTGPLSVWGIVLVPQNDDPDALHQWISKTGTMEDTALLNQSLFIRRILATFIRGRQSNSRTFVCVDATAERAKTWCTTYARQQRSFAEDAGDPSSQCGAAQNLQCSIVTCRNGPRPCSSTVSRRGTILNTSCPAKIVLGHHRERPTRSALFIIMSMGAAEPLSFTLCKSTGATNEWFRTLRSACPLEK